MFDSAETSGKKAPLSPPTPLLSVPGGSGRNTKSAPFLFPVYLLIITLEIRRCRDGAEPRLHHPSRGRVLGEVPGGPPAPHPAGLSPLGLQGGRGRHGGQAGPSFKCQFGHHLCKEVSQGSAVKETLSLPLPRDHRAQGVSRGVGSAKAQGNQG